MSRALAMHRCRLVGEAGEGVISTAIAVLIMALIGGLMWLAFQGIFQDASTRIGDEVQDITVG